MRSFKMALLVGSVCAALGACDRNEPQDPSGVQPTGYDQYGNPIYGQPGGYGQPQPGYGQPQPGYGQPAATGGAQNPVSPPCQSDAICVTHKCNMSIGRCAIPCGGPADCIAGASCMSGVCVPAVVPGAAPQQ